MTVCSAKPVFYASEALDNEWVSGRLVAPCAVSSVAPRWRGLRGLPSVEWYGGSGCRHGSRPLPAAAAASVAISSSITRVGVWTCASCRAPRSDPPRASGGAFSNRPDGHELERPQVAAPAPELVRVTVAPPAAALVARPRARRWSPGPEPSIRSPSTRTTRSRPSLMHRSLRVANLRAMPPQRALPRSIRASHLRRSGALSRFERFPLGPIVSRLLPTMVPPVPHVTYSPPTTSYRLCEGG
jgi:hypothetical protein